MVELSLQGKRGGRCLRSDPAAETARNGQWAVGKGLRHPDVIMGLNVMVLHFFYNMFYQSK
jgi:hypothetical protein